MGALLNFFRGPQPQEPREEEERQRQGVRDGLEVEQERERDEPEIQQQQPAGHTEYSLPPELDSSPVETQVQITESFLQPARDYVRDIDQRYSRALEKRREIDTLLKEFKEKLGLQANANFPACFQELRKNVGKFTDLDLDTDDERLKIELEDGARGDGVREAVEVFNNMLQKCSEFPAEVLAATTYINEKIQAVEKEYLQTEKTRVAIKTSKTSCKKICAFGEEIDKLVKDVELARDYLLPTVTGMIL